MTIEEALLAAANRGLTHLSLHPVFSDDRKTTYWRATATPSTMHKYISTQSLNPVEAILEVLKALPKAPPRRVTAAVKDEPRDLDIVEAAEAPHTPQPETIDTWLPKI